MAIYHMTAKTVSRGSGSSAKSRHEYIERKGRYEKDKEEVIEAVNGNMPEWAQDDPNKYWQAADNFERGNGRLFKQLEFALPKELSEQEQISLAQEFVDHVTSTKDGLLPYSFAIHRGHDADNPHCHLIISERINDQLPRTPETWFKRASPKSPELGGARKSTALRPKEWLLETRKEWENHANKALDMAGHKSRIDHRTLEAQGIKREPTRHRGVALNAMLKSGKLTLDDIQKPMTSSTSKEQELDTALALKSKINTGMERFRMSFMMLRLDKKRQEQEKKEKAMPERKRPRMGFSR